MPEIRCRKVRFLSPADEDSFFHFARGIAAVRTVVGDGDSIVLHIKPSISEASLRDLIALLYRYKADMAELAQFKNGRNSEWFFNPSGFWFKKVFRNDKKRTGQSR